MAYCGPQGIALSAFLSWPESDQEAALAWAAREARRCSGCGTHPDDWSEDLGGSRMAYHAEYYICPGCTESQRMSESKQVEKAGRGVHVRLAAGGQRDCDRCSPQ